MPFYTELPANNSGTRKKTDNRACVVEVTKDFRIVSPTEVILPGSSLTLNSWREVEGPVRKLTEREYVEILRRFGAEEQHIRAATIRLNRTPRSAA